MRTTVTIDDELFASVMRLTNTNTKSEAVRLALTEYVWLKRKKELLDLQGNVDIVDDLAKLRALEGGHADG